MFLRGHRRRRSARWAVIATGAVVATTLPGMSTAEAAVSGLTNGSVVSGVVTINEARGGTTPCVLGQDKSSSRLQVTRVADGASVFTSSKSGSGSWSANWNTVGQPLGQYRIRTWATDSKKSGLGNLGCSSDTEQLLSDITVQVKNHVAIALSAPAHVVTGESLPISVSATVHAPGAPSSPVANRDVTVTVPGVGVQHVTTGADGKGSTTFALPDLSSGPLSIDGLAGDDATYLGEGGTTTTTLDKRTSGTIYTGDTRAQPDTRAQLGAVLVDLTPDSARFGDPIADKALTLKLDSDTATVETTTSGRAIRSVPVSGQSRILDAGAAFAGDDVWQPSADQVSFFVGDASAPTAPVEHSTTGGYTRSLGTLLNNLLSPITNLLTPPATTPTLTLNGLLSTLLGPLGIDLWIDPIGNANLLKLADTTKLQSLLDTLLGTVTKGVSKSGDPVDALIDRVVKVVAVKSPLKDLADTARFHWRSTYVAADGRQVSREFGSIIGIPDPIDVTGDSVPDLLASVTLKGTTPVLKVARMDGAPANLPLSIQAVLTLPGNPTEYRFGYDTRTTNAPKAFQAEIGLDSAGATLKVTSKGDQALAVTGAVAPGGVSSATVPASNGDPARPALAPKEQRFGVSFDPAPASAALAIGLPNGQVSAQNIAATLSTDRPTRIGINLADDSGADKVFVANAKLDSVDGSLALGLTGSDEGAMQANLRSAHGLDAVEVNATQLTAGRTDSDIRLSMTGVPSDLSFGLGADGTGTMAASAPIGDFAAGYATNGKLALLDDPAYLRMLTDGDHNSVAVRLPGFEGMHLGMGDDLSLGLTMAPTPLHAVVSQNGLDLDATIDEAPHELTLGLNTDGNIAIEGSAPIDEVDLTAHKDDGIVMGATDLALKLHEIPTKLAVNVNDTGAVFDTGGDPIGLVELSAGHGDPVTVPGDNDGLTLSQGGPDGLELGARIHGLRKVAADLSSTPDVLLDTTAGKVFDIALKEYDDSGALNNDVAATIDHLVPNLHLGLVDDGTGAMQLHYAADEPTNSLKISMGGLKGSIANPLPSKLDICMAGDEACLPHAGLHNPALGSIRFSGNGYTTLNLTDPERGMTVTNLKLQRLDLTGDLDTDKGGPVYLNTADFGGECTPYCEHPIKGGTISADLSGAALAFTPGDGFSTVDARTDLVPTKILGQTTGMKGVGGTGIVRCVGATALKVTVKVIGLPITVDLKDAICSVPNRTPPGNPDAR